MMEVVGQLFHSYAQGDRVGGIITSFGIIIVSLNQKRYSRGLIMVRQSLERFVGRGRVVLVVVFQLGDTPERE
jgi:hypothetical protein